MTRQRIKPRPGEGGDDRWVIDHDRIALLLSENPPMPMVDRVVDYSGRGQVSAEWYVSSNEPALEGHFGERKIWPGVYIIEGLRQCCLIGDALARLEAANMLDAFRAAGRVKVHREEPDRVRSGVAAAGIPGEGSPGAGRAAIQVKLLAPVLPGCVVEYHVRQVSAEEDQWRVRAEVDGKAVAKGMLTCPRFAG